MPHSYDLYLNKWRANRISICPAGTQTKENATLLYSIAHHKWNRMLSTFIYFSRLLYGHICNSWSCCLNVFYSYDVFTRKKCLFLLPFLCSVQNRSRIQLYFILLRLFNIKKLYIDCVAKTTCTSFYLHHKIHSLGKTIAKRLVWASAVCILARTPSSMMWSGTSVSSASFPEAAAP